MSKGTAIDLGLTEAYNDLFSTQEERDNVGRTFVIDLDPTEISDFPNHKLITLSTCEYSRNNGRMVVVAKLITPPSMEVGGDA